MILATKRLILRPFTKADIPSIHIYSSKPSVTEFMMWGPNTREDTEDFVTLVLRKAKEKPRYNYDFVVTLKDGTLIGACGLYFSDPERPPTLGWVYDDTYWGKGYATEAARALISFAFKTLKVSVVHATCDVRNVASSRVMEKNGMRFVTKRLRDLPKIGKHEEALYELTLLEYNLNNHKTYI